MPDNARDSRALPKPEPRLANRRTSRGLLIAPAPHSCRTRGTTKHEASLSPVPSRPGSHRPRDPQEKPRVLVTGGRCAPRWARPQISRVGPLPCVLAAPTRTAHTHGHGRQAETRGGRQPLRPHSAHISQIAASLCVFNSHCQNLGCLGCRRKVTLLTKHPLV